MAEPIYLSQDETARLIEASGPARTALALPWGSTDPKGLRLLDDPVNDWARDLVRAWRADAR